MTLKLPRLADQIVEHPTFAVAAIDHEDKMQNTGSSPQRKVLLVEDDDTLRSNYSTLLNGHRLDVRACATKVDAISNFESYDFDVVILDVTLGDDYEAGFDLCQKFRAIQKITPIIFLTERDDDHDRISGLRLGADDYLSKTISGAYLAARINALIRRVETISQGHSAKDSLPILKKGSHLQIDDRLSTAYWDKKPLKLTLTQFWILKDLFNNQDSVRTTDDLMRAAKITVQQNTIVAHVKSIRDEIQKIDPSFSSIRSERARGYRWVDG